ncbi:DUF484 family protein [Photobacterium damselae]|uniref:DUF484 family protein n=1 Tax=Photobacterium damselae TaxID=38293 RepID=UPI0030F49335
MNASSSLAEQASCDELSAEQVASYLRKEPDFFARHPELLSQIRVHHDERGTVSLVDIQLEKLRGQVTQLQDQLEQLTDQAKRNDQLFQQFSSLQAKLMQARCLQQVMPLMEQFAQQYQLNISIRLLAEPEAAKPLLKEINSDVAWLSRESFTQFQRSFMPQQNIYLGRLRHGQAALFFSQPPDLGSFALLPLKQHQTLGVLGFSSTEGGHFHPAMDTLFLQQLAIVMSSQLALWLDEAVL